MVVNKTIDEISPKPSILQINYLKGKQYLNIYWMNTNLISFFLSYTTFQIT